MNLFFRCLSCVAGMAIDSASTRPPSLTGRLPAPPSVPTHTQPQPPVASSPKASTTETIEMLRGNLVKELYRFELDLTGGLRIAGKPCDCGAKHTMGLEAMTEELVPMDRQAIYGKMLDWLGQHKASMQPDQVGQHPPDYYRALAPEVREFRKELMDSKSVS